MTDQHILPDVLAPGLKVVFCGSAAGRVSARRRAYYAGPGNRFWPMLHDIGLTPRRLRPEEFRVLPTFGLGLTDLCKTAAGGDHELPRDADDGAGLLTKIARFEPACLAFVGKRAAAVALATKVGYGRQARTIGPTAIVVLPSPSGAARRYWDEKPWYDLAALVRDGAGGASGPEA